MTPRVPHPCRLFLFDLDGTLIDSKIDIAAALNRALRASQLPELSLAQVVAFVGDGVRSLVTRALCAAGRPGPDEMTIQHLLDRYLAEYEAHPLDATRLYPGVAETLDRLDWARFGVVTNKPERLSRRILEGLGLTGRFGAIVGGDSIPERKPDPEPLRFAMARCGAGPFDSVMVGDSAVDVAAGRAAALFTCGLASGFRGKAELEVAGCDLILERFADLPHYFGPPDPR